MTGEVFIHDLGWIVIGAALFALIARQLRLPSLVAYLVVGLLLGPATGLVEMSDALDLIAEAGIVLLLFLVGMELSFDKIRGMGKAVLFAGFGQVIITFGLGLLLCVSLGLPRRESVFLAAALTFSSTVVVVKLLEEKQEFGLLHGRLAVGILLFQDLVALVLLTFLGSFSPQTELELVAIASGVGRSLAAMSGLVVVVLGMSRYVLPRPFAWAARSSSALLIWSLCWCFFIVAGAHVLHLSPETGAFLAGIALAQLPYNHDLRRRVRPLMDFFVAVFFVTLGAQMHLGSAVDQWPVALALIVFALVVKFLVLMTVLARCGFGQRAAHQASLSLSQISEFSFVIVALGVKGGWIGEEILSLVGIVGLVTFSVSACAIVYSNSIYILVVRWDLLRFFGAREETELEERHIRRNDHIIIVGLNTLGRRLVHQFCERGESVLAIDTDPAKLAAVPCDTLLGNVEYLSVLEEADLSRARLLISALQIEPTNDLLAYRCRHFDVPCAILVVDLSLTDNLLEMDVDYLMVPKVDGIKLQQRELERRGFLPT